MHKKQSKDILQKEKNTQMTFIKGYPDILLFKTWFKFSNQEFKYKILIYDDHPVYTLCKWLDKKE